jgi:hypothetical protein
MIRLSKDILKKKFQLCLVHMLHLAVQKTLYNPKKETNQEDVVIDEDFYTDS